MSLTDRVVAQCERHLTGEQFVRARQRSALVLLVIGGSVGVVSSAQAGTAGASPSSLVGLASFAALTLIVVRFAGRDRAWWWFTVILAVSELCGVLTLGDQSGVLVAGHTLAGLWCALFLSSGQMALSTAIRVPMAAYSVSVSGLLDPWGTGVMALFMAIGALGMHGAVIGMRSLAERLEQARLDAERTLATDSLTGAASRREVSRLLRNAEAWLDQPLGLALADLDHFKQVNDSLGHLGGDTVLIEAAAALSDAFGSATVGRWGGEEFVVLTGPISAEELQTRSERACRAVAATGTATVSIGIHLWSPGTTVDQALRFTDQALYRAKAAGRNRVCWWTAMDDPAIADRSRTIG